MSNLTLRKLSLEQLDGISSDKTLVILHPANYQHNRFLTYHLLAQGSMVYLHLPRPHTTFSEVLDLLQETFATQAGLRLELPGQVSQAAEAIARQMNGRDTFNLVVDSYDWAADESVDQLMIALARRLEPNRRVTVCGRNLPLQILASGEAGVYSAMVPCHPAHMLIDYGMPTEDRTILEVRSLGPGIALINGRTLTTWDGVLPKCLFFYMVDRAMTTRNEIFDTFWPDLKKREATNVFHVTKRKVSEILGQDLTTYSAGFYRIADNIELFYDVVTFQEAVQNAAVADDEDEIIQCYQQAIQLYRGPFLSTLDQDWVKKRREELQAVYAEALTGLARIYDRHGKKEESLGLYLRAAASMPQREDLVRAVMMIYRDLDLPERAIQVYDRLERELEEKLGVTPSPETVEMAQAVRRMMA